MLDKMLDKLTLEQKKWLVQNRAVITTLVTASVPAAVEGCKNFVNTVILNDHQYTKLRIVRCREDEDFIIVEESDGLTDLRDQFHPEYRKTESEAVAISFDLPDAKRHSHCDCKKKKKDKDKDKKERRR